MDGRSPDSSSHPPISYGENRDRCIVCDVPVQTDALGEPVAATFTARVDVEVSRVSRAARAAIEANGGRVTKVHYNRLGLRALLKPHKFPKGPPKPARTPVYLKKKVDREGALPAPEREAFS